MTEGDGWKADNIENIPARNENYAKGWHSVGFKLGINSFGVNAKTVNRGDSLTPEHTEVESGQQELFVILSGKAEFLLDGKLFIAKAGFAVAVEPTVRRKVTALENNTTMLTVGAKPGEAYIAANF